MPSFAQKSFCINWSFSLVCWFITPRNIFKTHKNRQKSTQLGGKVYTPTTVQNINFGKSANIQMRFVDSFKLLKLGRPRENGKMLPASDLNRVPLPTNQPRRQTEVHFGNLKALAQALDWTSAVNRCFKIWA